MECPICKGVLGFLGRLGLLNHYQCRNCGAAFSQKVIEEEGDLEETGIEWGEYYPDGDEDA